jgi:hypothetical protein
MDGHFSDYFYIYLLTGEKGMRYNYLEIKVNGFELGC